jgi:aspartate/methionine/tyrosine aminotransferase
LKEADVNVVAGRGFGRYGEGHIRLSYATTEEKIIEGLVRMKSVLETLPRKS